MRAWISPLLMARFAPLRITLSSTCTVRSLISRSATPGPPPIVDQISQESIPRSLWHGAGGGVNAGPGGYHALQLRAVVVRQEGGPGRGGPHCRELGGGHLPRPGPHL